SDAHVALAHRPGQVGDRRDLHAQLVREIAGELPRAGRVLVEGEGALEWKHARERPELDATLIAAAANGGRAGAGAGEVLRGDGRRRAGPQDGDLDRVHHRQGKTVGRIA